MDFMPLRLNSSNLTCSICALAAIVLQLVAMECQKPHMVDSPIHDHPFIVRISYSANFIMILCNSCLYHLCLLSGSIKIFMSQMFVLVYSD